MRVELRNFEEKLGIDFPDELIASLGWEPGDLLEVELEGKGVKITRVETAFERGMRIAERVMEEYREALETLAKT